MTGFFLKSSTGGHTRSISLPARSHSTTLKIEEELIKLKNFDVSSSSYNADKLRIAISGLAELYKSIGHLLKLPLSKQVLTRNRDSSWLDELLEESVSFLDVCENIRESIPLVRASIRKLQSALRRRNNGRELGIEDGVAEYVSSLKYLKREMAKSLVFLKQTDSKLEVPLMFNKANNDHHLLAVARVFKETTFMSSLVFKSILGYFSATELQPKATKWSLVLKLVHNKHEDHLSELEDVEASLNNLMVRNLNRESTRMMIQSACLKLNALETKIEGLEKELECLFRELILARVTLLNILSDNQFE